MGVKTNQTCTIDRIKDDREPLGFQLVDNEGTPIDLMSLTITAETYDIQNKVQDEAGMAVTITDEPNGLIQWTPTTDSVDTTGDFALYFIDNSTPSRRWPYDGTRLILRVIEPWQQ